MFRRRADVSQESQATPTERITSVVADGVNLRGKLTGEGGVRIEGTFEGEIQLEGLLVIGPSGRVTCEELNAKSVIVAGAMRGNIHAERVEIRSSGRVWGDVITTAMSTQEGAFLRGQIQMEEKVEIGADKASSETGGTNEGKEKIEKPARAKTKKKSKAKTSKK
jgi:cytoskeletal protein CcmA (bactofilin family)